jgi:ketosteroid isomerase-like protein
MNHMLPGGRPTEGTEEVNTSIVRRYFDAANTGDLDALDDLPIVW